MGKEPSGRRGRLTALVAAVAAVPALLDLLLSDRARVFAYFEADAFYYLTIARNWADGFGSSFDMEHLTNGYHPAWQLFLTIVFWFANALKVPESTVLGGVVVFGVALVTFAFALLAHLAPRRGLAAVALPLFPVGVTAVLLAPAWLALGPDGVVMQSWQSQGRVLVGTAWSYANGMESAFVLVGFALAVACFVAPARKRWHPLALGLALAATTLARLDHGLITLCVLVGYLALHRDARTVLTAGAAYGLPILGYLAWNRATFGSAMPVSGAAKSTFPHPDPSVLQTIGALVTDPPAMWLAYLARAGLLVVPVVLALVFLGVAIARRKPLHRWDALLASSSAGVLWLGTYNALFVPFTHQGGWYYPLATTVASLIVLRGLDALGDRVQPSPGMRRVLLAVATVCALLCFGLHRGPRHGHMAEFYYETAPVLRAYYAETLGGSPKWISVDDGIVAFATGFPTLSGIGLALDAEAAQALEEDALLSLAQARGFNRVTSLAYFSPQILGPGVERIVPQLGRAFPLNRFRDIEDYALSLDFATEDRRFIVIAFAPLSD